MKDLDVVSGLAESIVSFSSSSSSEDVVQKAQENLKKHPRVKLSHLPTPLEYCTNLSQELGVELYIKRDDCTGLATGGNKARKLGKCDIMYGSYFFPSSNCQTHHLMFVTQNG